MKRSGQGPASVKYQEFFAHSGNVNSCCLGKTFNGILATGGDDRRVNIWKIHKNQGPIMSLAGHQTEIDCVNFNTNEDILAGGSRGGSIKLWNLKEEKCFVTLTGHRASIRSLDFHPYGNFIASGSLDTNLKLWDIRKKGCMQTYRGHDCAITSLTHSPDGRWVVSGDNSGLIKIWDLAAGKCIFDFKQKNSLGPVVGMAFHPVEVLLATANEKSINTWDCENFQLVSTTSKEPTNIRCISYSKDGMALLAAGPEMLRSWCWEPVQIYDSLEVSWSGLCDMSVTSDNDLIAVCRKASTVSIYHVDLPNMEPFASGNSVDDINNNPSIDNEPGDEKSINEPFPSSNLNNEPVNSNPSQAQANRSKITSKPNAAFFNNAAVEKDGVGSVKVERSGGTANNSVVILSPSAPNPHRSNSNNSNSNNANRPPLQQVNLNLKNESSTVSSVNPSLASHQMDGGGAVNLSESRKWKLRLEANKNFTFNDNPQDIVASLADLKIESSESNDSQPSPLHSPSPIGVVTKVKDSNSVQPSSNGTSRSPSISPSTSAAQLPTPSDPINNKLNNLPSTQFSSIYPSIQADPQVLVTNPSSSATPSSMNPNNYNRKPAAVTLTSNPSIQPSQPSPPNDPAFDVESLRLSVMKDHLQIKGVLKQRLENIRILKKLWGAGRCREAVLHLVKINDPSTSFDFLVSSSQWWLSNNGGPSNPSTGILNLEIVNDLLFIIHQLLQSRMKEFVRICLRYLKYILSQFSNVIISTRSVSSVNLPVNLALSERKEKCNAIYQHLKLIYPTISNLHNNINDQSMSTSISEVRQLIEQLFKI